MSTADGERDDDGSVDVEAAWADIVARWDDEGPRTGPWPAAEDATTGEAGTQPAPSGWTGSEQTGREQTGSGQAQPGQAQPEQSTEPHWGRPASHVGGEAVRAAGGREEPADDDGGGYVPPDPPPLPRGDTVSRLAWAGVLGAPVFFLLTMLFWRSVPTVLVVLAVLSFVAGFVTLVVRMPDRHEDGWDDGAVV